MSIRRVHHLNCATMCPLAKSLFGGREMIAHCVLVETERDGLVLIDTGFGTLDIAGKTGLSGAFKKLAGPKLDMAETAIAQVQALGFTADDVKHIVVTHLDLDHAGGLPDFPKAQVHLHAKEHHAATERPSLRERERYLKAHWAHGPTWQTYSEQGDTWRGLPAITKLRGVDADIGIVPMHGHTRGHCAVIARTDSRWLVHAGDAYFHRGSVEGTAGIPLGFAMFERAVQIDAPARRASVSALRALRASYDDVDLFCAHDTAEYETMRTRARA